MRGARVDNNQKEIVQGLRRVGATVLHTHQLKNAFDILVGYRGVNYIMEIKDGSKPPSQRKLTEGEMKFKESWRGGEYHVVNSLDEALDVIYVKPLKLPTVDKDRIERFNK